MRVVNVRAGPGSSTLAQWAKSGTQPDCAACVGCIITQAFAEAVWSCLASAQSSSFPPLLKEFETLLSSPQKYLDPKCLHFLHCYVAAGNFGAYAPYLPLRCAYSKYSGAKLTDPPGEPLDLIISDKIQNFVHDGSWTDARCQTLRSCLVSWLKAGLPPSIQNLYVDTVTGTEYSQLTLQSASNKAFERLALVCTASLHKYHLELHRLVLAAVGQGGLLSLSDTSLPGTVEFHQSHFSRRLRLATSGQASGSGASFSPPLAEAGAASRQASVKRCFLPTSNQARGIGAPSSLQPAQAGGASRQGSAKTCLLAQPLHRGPPSEGGPGFYWPTTSVGSGMTGTKSLPLCLSQSFSGGPGALPKLRNLLFWNSFFGIGFHII